MTAMPGTGALRKLRVGTRGSALALTQTAVVSKWLAEKFPGTGIETIRIRTTGDIRSSDPISSMAGRGVFVDAIEQALVEGKIDFAVHSAKDLPPRNANGLTIAAYPTREDARDVLVSREKESLRFLREGAVVGTSSRRRSCQIRAIRPTFEIAELRGNVDTRLRKLESGEYDAIILAAAGLIRLGMTGGITEWLTTDDMLPAPCQGSLAVQVRSDDTDLLNAFADYNDPPTVAAVLAERRFLETLGTGCAAPVAAYAVVNGDQMKFEALVQSQDGKLLREHASCSVDTSLDVVTAIGYRMQSAVSRV